MAVGGGALVEGAGLGADGRGDLVQQLLVPGRSQAYRLREHGGRSQPGHAVQAFGTGLEGGQSEARDSW